MCWGPHRTRDSCQPKATGVPIRYFFLVPCPLPTTLIPNLGTGCLQPGPGAGGSGVHACNGGGGCSPHIPSYERSWIGMSAGRATGTFEIKGRSAWGLGPAGGWPHQVLPEVGVRGTPWWALVGSRLSRSHPGSQQLGWGHCGDAQPARDPASAQSQSLSRGQVPVGMLP